MTRRTSEEILAHADELADRFEVFEPDHTEETDALDGLGLAVIELANAQKNLDLWVEQAREQRKTWSAIGEVLGVSGEAVRQKYSTDNAVRKNRPIKSRNRTFVHKNLRRSKSSDGPASP